MAEVKTNHNSFAIEDLKQSLINLENITKSELTKMRDMDLIHTNPNEYAKVLNSITNLNKQISTFLALLSKR